MAVELRVPQMGESISEATIFRWLVKEGDSFPAGAELVELETDKANSALAAEKAGTLERILKNEGETVGVNDTLAILSESAAAASSASGAEAVKTPPAQETAHSPADNGRPAHATPMAARVAAAQGVDLAQVQGSGISGRILTDDVKRAAQTPRTETPQTAAPLEPTTPAPLPSLSVPAAAADDPRIERRPMSRMRLTIAKYLKQAQNTAAMLTTFNEVDMTAIMEIRKRRKEAFEKRNGIGLGFMSFFTKATVGALKAFPMLNAEIEGSDILIKHFYDIGIAVSTKDGLVVPIIRDADKKSFAEIEKDVADLAGRARERKLSAPELQGGTFTITNGGVFGSLLSTPILAYPQVGILGMHKIEERPIALNGQVVIRPMMYLALSYDHRIVDGSESVRFLVRIKEMLEDPETLLLEG